MALLALTCLAPAHAGDRLTAREAVELALSQPHIQAELEAGTALASSEVVAARTWRNPDVSVGHEELDDDASAPGRETSVMLSQEVELGGRRGLRIRAAEAGVAAAERTSAYRRVQLRGEVLGDYYAALAAGRRIQAQEKISSGLASLAGIAGKRHVAGDLSGYESRRIAQSHARAQARRSQATAEERAARTRLAAWIGERALTAELDASFELPAAVQGADATSAELDALWAERTHAEARLAAASRLALPVTVGVGNKRIRQGNLRDDALMLELSVPLPLFDRNQAERARAAAELKDAEARHERAQRHTRARRAAALEEGRQLADSARHLLAVLVPEAAELTDIARASFAEGELDLVGLLDAYAAEADLVEHALEQQARALDALVEFERLSPVRTDSPTPTH